MDRLFKVSPPPAPRPRRGPSGWPAPWWPTGRLPQGCSHAARQASAPQGQGRQVERGDRCEEQHIGDDQRAFLAGTQASQRAGGKIAHGESDAECGRAQSDLGHVQGIAQAHSLPTAERRRHPSRSTVPWRAGVRDVRLAQPSQRRLRGRNRRRRWGATAGHGHAADEKGGEAARRDQQERRAPAYPAGENTGDGRPVAMPAVMPSMTTPIAAAHAGAAAAGDQREGVRMMTAEARPPRIRSATAISKVGASAMPAVQREQEQGDQQESTPSDAVRQMSEDGRGERIRKGIAGDQPGDLAESTPKARPSGSSIAESMNSLAPTKNTDMESMDNNGPLLPARAIVLEWGMPFLVNTWGRGREDQCRRRRRVTGRWRGNDGVRLAGGRKDRRASGRRRAGSDAP